MGKDELKMHLLKAIQMGPYCEDIQSLALFGSFVQGQQKEASDIDLLIDFLPEATVGYFKLARIQRYLQNCLGRRVDLLTPDAVSTHFREQVLQQAEYIFER